MRVSRIAIHRCLVSLFLLTLACRPSVPSPQAGAIDYQSLARVAVPGGVVNAAGGNGMIQRTDLSIDTRLGRVDLGATWNTAAKAWHWSFDLSKSATHLVDRDGARHALAGVALGAAIPGAGWRLIDGTTLATKGGWVHEFDAQGRILRVHWASHAYPSLEWRWEGVPGALEVGRIEQCTSASSCDPVFLLERDSTGRLETLRDRSGRAAEFSYDGAGNLIVARDALDTAQGWVGTRYEYASGQLSAVTNGEGERVEWQADSLGRVTQVRQVGPSTPTWSFVYRSQNPNVTEISDPVGAVTRVGFDAERRVQFIENGLGETTLFEWAGRRPSARVSPAGVRVEWVFADDELVVSRAANGHETFFEHPAAAVDRSNPYARPVSKIYDSLGVIEERIFDPQGRLVEVRNGAGEATVYAYHPDQSIAQVTTSDGYSIQYSGYEEHGHATVQDHPAERVYLRFDAVGNQLIGPAEGTEADPMHGGIVRRGFDENRNLASVVLADGPVHSAVERTLIVRTGSDGRRLAIERPYGGDSIFTYDGLGRRVARSDYRAGAWRTTSFGHDVLGRLISVTRPNGMSETQSYDLAGRSVRHKILRDGVVESESSVVWSGGRVISINDSANGGAESWTHDGAGRPARVLYPAGEQVWRFYDARSRLDTEVFWDANQTFVRSIRYGYDTAGRQRTLSDGAQLLVERNVQQGRLHEIRYGNGLTRSFRYSSSGELRSSQTVNALGQSLEVSSLDQTCGTFVPTCQRVSTQTFGSAAGTSALSYQVHPAKLAGDGSQGGLRLQLDVAEFDSGGTYEFDALSNVSTRNALIDGCHEAWSLQYDNQRTELQSAGAGPCGSIQYTFDEAGFVTQRNGSSLEWDGAGRIQRVGNDRFAWDGQGRPVSRERDGVTTAWRFGGRVEADAQGAMLAMDLGQVRIDLTQGRHLYRHLDFRNNVKFVTDDQGDVIAHYRYLGHRLLDVVAGDGSADPHRRFAGGLDLGDLVLLGHRLLDARVGRFLAPDPVFQLINQYAYTLGNPVQYWDPDGRYQLTLSRALSIASIGVGIAGLVVSSPALALGLGIASVTLGIAALVVDATAVPSGLSELSTPGPIFDPPIPAPPAPPATPGGGGGQIKVLEITVLPSGSAVSLPSLDFGGGLGIYLGGPYFGN